MVIYFFYESIIVSFSAVLKGCKHLKHSQNGLMLSQKSHRNAINLFILMFLPSITKAVKVTYLRGFLKRSLENLCHFWSRRMIYCYCCTRSRDLQVQPAGQANQVLEDKRSESTYVFHRNRKNKR